MLGGYLGTGRGRRAVQLSAAALVGAFWGLGVGTVASPARADDIAAIATDDCNEKSKPEKSIVVSQGKVAEDDPSVAIATDKNEGDELAPIAIVSEYEPDLAEPVAVASDKQTSEKQPTEKQPEHAAPTAAAESESQLDQDVLSFQGVTPGISNRTDVLREWGNPQGDDLQARTLLYKFEKMPSVRVSFDGDMVDAVIVQLSKPLTADALVRKLGMEEIRPATLTDATGVALAQAFPERGVVLRFTSGQRTSAVSDVHEAIAEVRGANRRVGEIVIQPIKAAAFLLRAVNNAQLHFSQSIEDLQHVLELDRTSAHAKWLLSDIYLTIGQAVTAERYAAEATESEPDNHAYHLQWAKCLRELARYDRAVQETRKVLESPTIDAIVRAQALHEMGLLAALGSEKVTQRAVPLQTKAIEIADQLAASDDVQVSQAAKELLVDAHLAIAVQIARGRWSQKEQNVPLWIERASALAEEMIAADPKYLSLRLQVAVSALAAAASLDPPIDPQPWIEEAKETAQLIREATDDPLIHDQVDWQLGLAYFQAAQIEYHRDQPDNALRLGKLAKSQLAELSKKRDELPDTAYLMGRLYFQIGVIYAVHNDDHVVACQWYDRAADLLLHPVPVTTMAAPRQHGDALVSMGVSYWQTNRRERAIELTQSGVDLIEKAVADGLLESDALAIPYGNLAAMYQAQGEKEPAERYTKLAKKLSGSPSTAKRR